MATQATGGGSTTSFSNTPQATNDIFTSGLTAAGVSISLTEDNLQPVFFDVMGNDLGGNAKTLFSIDNGINNSGAMSGYSAADLLTQDTARVEATSSDTSLNGAKIWITADGKVGYDASALSAQVAALSAGDFFTDSFIYAIRLGNGTLSWATATVRIAGVNDGPVAAADTSAVKEDTAPNSVSGNVLINDTDADTHDSHSVTAINGSATKVGADVVGTYGTLHLNSDGTYTYTLNNAQANVQALAADQLVYDTFSYTNSDNHGGSCTANLTITVTGTNDAPVITSSAQSGLAAEWADLSAAEGSNTPHTASGAVTFTDVDTLDSHTASFAPQGGGYLGSFTLNTTNHDTGNGGSIGWSFSVADDAIDYLQAGQTLTQKYDVTISDGHGGTAVQTVTVTIVGTNDAPVIISSAQSGLATEWADMSAAEAANTPHTASGAVAFTDVDTLDSHTASFAPQGGGYLGSFTLDTTNHDTGNGGAIGWSFSIADGAVDYLQAGQTLTQKYDVTISDGHGGTAVQTVTVTIVGTNDAPVITSATQSGTVSEGDDLPAAAHTATGHVTFSDVDASDTHTHSVSVAAAHGTATVDPDGTWHYTVLDSGAVDALAAGEHLADSFTVEVDDHHGGLATQVVSIDITGTNDAPMITSAAQSGTVSEGDDLPAAAQTATGQVSFSDVDASDTHTLSVSVAAAHGTATVDPDGTWHYTVLDSGAVDALAAGEHLADSFTVEVDDHHGGLATQVVSIDITGTNDAPMITSAAQSGTVSEGDDLPAAAQTATGQVSFSDVDASDTHTLSVSVAAAHGTATVDPDGTWHYTVLDSGAVDALAVGEHLADSFTVEVDDHHGGLATQQVTIDITGTNDAPVITSSAQSGTVSEGDDLPAAAQTAIGQVSFSDVDASDTHTLSVSVAAAHGTATVDPDGTWHYTVLDSGAVDALAAGEHLADSFTVEVDDHHGGLATQQVTIDITGTNDAPVAVADTDSGLEDSTITGTVASNDSDIDDGAVLTYAQTSAVAGLALNPDGSYSLDAGNAAYQHLAQGATTDVVANYTVTDEHGATSSATLTITLTGTNDAPVAVADTDSGLEDSTITGTVASNDSDVDDGATLSYSLDAAVAGLTLNPDGSYSLDAGNAAYQHLAQGATTDVVANYTVTDEHGATSNSSLTITLSGTNDAPVAVADTDSGLEDSTITGTVASNDSDVDDGAILSYSLDAAVTGLTLNPDGSYSLDAGNAAYQHLAQGATTDVVANYTVTDEHGATSSATLTITLTGTNDAPVAVADTDSGLEDSTITGTVASNDSDVDDGAILSYSLDAAVTGLTLNPDGSYSLDAGNAAYQHLAQGATTDVVANYTVTDEHGATSSATLTITLTGTNDAPVAVADTDSGLEDSTITGTVASNDSDIDDGPVLTYAQTSAVAGLALNPDGSYSLDAGNAAYQHLAQGATTDVVANYTVTDEHGATSNSSLTITLTGTNDAPVAVADTDSGLEDSTITGTVASNDSDIDDGAVLTYAQTSAVAGLALNPDGSYSLDAGNAAYQHLAQGATTDVVANYTVTDEHGATSSATLTITLTGTNDAPVAVADTDSGLEDSTITGTVASNDSDVDDGATLSYSLDAAVAGLTLNPDGSYSLDAGNAAYQHLAQGATTDVVANYTVTDEHGATSNSSLTITLSGTNDAPVAVADTDSGLEDSTITGTVASNDSDVDDGAILSYSLDAAVTGLTLNPDGSYSLDAGNAAYQHLAQGATTDVVANYTVTDEHGATSSATLTITLTGTNDAPVAVADTDSGLEDSTITGTVASNDSDIDDGPVLTYAQTSAVAGLALNPDGSYSLDAGNAAYQHLAQGATTDVVANYTVTDEHGATSNSTLTITLTGTNDAPVAVADTDSGLEDSTITGTVASNDSDIDDGAVLTYAQTSAVAGLALNPDGSYSLDAGNAAYQHLAQGATTDVVANYTVTDEHGATSSATLTITLTGTNDAPVAVADTDSGLEDSTITGTVASNDSDVDDGATLSYSLDAAVAGLTLNPDGSYSLDAGNAAYQHLAQGATTDVVANYTVTDEHGATSNSSLTITLSGTNDAPVAVADTDSGLEDSTITGTVASNDSDVDDGAILSYSLDAAVTGLTLNPDGSYSLDAGNAAYQHLAQGATTDVVANYTVTDEHGATSSATLTITLTGTNDAPVAVADTDSGLEDSTITGTVASNDSDIDDGPVLTYAQTSAVAGLALNPDGSYSLDAGNAAYQHLAQGATTDVVANYTVTDEHGATSNSTLTITLTGTNDAPVAVADTDSGLEDSTITGTVASNDSDIDDGAVLTYAQTSAVAGLALNPDGSYSLDAGNAAYQHLAQGATTDVVANYTVTDEHGATSSATLTITLTGTNDAPVAVADTDSGLEDSTITGTVASNDSDVDDGATLSYSLDAAVAGLTLNPDGSYSLDAGNAAYQHLAQGATTDVVANYTVTDEHGATSNSSLTITLSGTNDAPVAVADTDSGLEDSTITGTVASNDSDVDDGAILSYSLDAAVTGLTLNPDGSYSLDAGNAAYQHLAQGATTDVVANYTVTDEHGATSSATLTITLTGTNDAPVAVADTDSGLEDSTITGTVASNDSDVDDGAILSYSLDAAVTGLTLNPDGSYSLDAGNAAYQHLAQGATTDVVANYTVTDEHGATSSATLTITLTGTNDAPVAVADTDSGLEDSTITGTVASNDSDIDDGPVLTYAQTSAVAGLALNPDGSYSLDAGNAAYQHLAQGATTDVVANYTVTDEHGATSSATLTITLTGTNDAPVAVADTDSGLEDSTITGTVASNDSDVDDGAILTYAQTSAVAGLTINADGSYSFDAANAAYQHLAQGATTDVVANYTVTDEHGATSNSTLTITLTGTNDAPVAVADTDSGLEDSTITGTVASNDSDVDDGATLSYSLDAAVAGLTLNPDGSYSLDAANAAYQHLAQGATTDVVANYTVTDEHGASAPSTLTITLTGTNDAPVLNANGGSLPYTENQAATAIDTVLTASDVDSANLTGATVSITANFTSGQDVLGFSNQNGITGSYNASTGVLTLTGSATVAQYQAALESVTYFNSSDNPSGTTRTISYQVDDGQTANHASNIVTSTVAVTPVNDAPVVVAGHTLNYTENQAATAIDPALTLSDVDSANLSSATVQITGNYVTGQDVLGFTNQNGITGSFNAATGTLTLTGSSSVANYQTALDSVTYLNTSDNPSGVARTVTIITNDGTANSVAVTDAINVTPVNDAPVGVAGHTLNYTENQAATAIDPALTLSDVDNANLASATVQITGNYVNGQDVLGFTNQNGITGSFNAATGTLTLTGSSSVANYQTALDSVTYLNTSDNPSGVARTVTIITNDGTANSVAVTDTINVTPVNDAPVVVAGHTLNYTENQAATAIDPALTLSDVDSANLSSATVQITGNYVTGQDVLGFTNQNGITGSFNAATGTLTLTGSSSVANYQTALDSVTYLNTSDNPSGLARTVTIITNDGTANSVAVTDTINVTPVNDAPVGVNDTGSATEAGGTGNGTAGSNATGNVLTNDTDVDNTNASLVVSAIRTGAVEGSGTAGTLGSSLVGAHGTLTLNANGSYTYVVNDSDSAVQALNSGQTITDSFNYAVKDPGNLTDTAVLTVTINGANDAPVNTVPGTQEVVQNTNVTFNGAKLISISDVDVGAGTETVTLSVAHGTLTLSGTTGLSFTTGDGTTDATMTFSGTAANINNALNGLLYNPTDTFVGADTLTITTTDQGGLSDSDTVTINQDSPNPGTLTTSSTDVIFYASGTNTVNATNLTLNGTDSITGGTGTDTLIVTGGSPGPFTFGNGVGNLFLTNFEVFKLVDTNSGNHTDNVTFLSAFQNNGALTVDATGIGGNGKLNLDASAVTSGAFIVIGGDSDDTLKTGSGDDTLTGGLGNDTLTGGADNDTFNVNSGTDSVTDLSGNDVLVISAGATANATVTAAFTATSSTSNAGTANLSSNGFAVDLSAATGANGFTVTNTGAAAAITGSAQNDTLIGGSGNDTLAGGSGADSITGGSGADTMTGGAGSDTFVINSGQSLGTVGGSGDAGTISGYDAINDFATTGTNDILDLPVTNVTANTAGTNGTDSTLTISGQTVKSHAITNGVITFDDANAFASALTLTSTANVAAVVQYLHNNDIATGTGAAVAFVANIAGTAHNYVFEQVGTTPNAASDILVDLVGVTLTNISQAHLAPAGIAGEAINLGLTNPVDHVGTVSVSVSGIPAGWTLSEGTDNGDGTWSVQTNDVTALTITTLDDYAGAVSLHISQTWTDSTGGTGLAMIADNVEAYGQGSPIFALSGDDNLTGSTGDDLFVFSQPIGHDVIYSFDAASDQIDLIGYANFTGFGDIQAHMANDAAGDAVITLADGQSITLNGVDASSLTADDFVFDHTPVTENPGHMVISDGAILPLSGIIDNTGTIELNSTGNEADLQLIELGITLQGGGHVELTDSSENVITGTVADVTLTNVDNTIAGAGHLGDGVMTLVNESTIIATGTNSLDIDTGTNAITNSGTFEATGAGGLVIHSDVINTGVLWANDGDVTIDGNVSGNGSALISGTATLAFAHASAENTTFAAGATGTLILGDSFNFSGTVSGMTADDHIDLLDFNFASAPTLNYTPNADSSGGTLSITDGAHTANIALLGTFDPTGFQIEADKTTGTLVSYHDFHLA
ncbi:VCBS repeat-containing protein [Bradyrhizobium diazoefficiens]